MAKARFKSQGGLPTPPVLIRCTLKAWACGLGTHFATGQTRIFGFEIEGAAEALRAVSSSGCFLLIV